MSPSFLLIFLLSLAPSFGLTSTQPRAHVVTVIVSMVPDDASALSVGIGNEDYERVSTFEMHGERQQVVEFRGVPGGEYLLQAVATSRQGKVTRTSPRQMLVR